MTWSHGVRMDFVDACPLGLSFPAGLPGLDSRDLSARGLTKLTPKLYL